MSDAVSKRRKVQQTNVQQALLVETSCSKSSIARILNTLHDSGVLVEGALRDPRIRSIRGDLTRSAAAVGQAMTPFGPLMNTMTLPTRPAMRWDYISPMALIYKLSQLSTGFCALMLGVIGALRPNEPLRIVLFCDECRPGNVLRPDKGRATQHLLWTFANFPEWLLVRDQGWFTFGVVRSAAIASLPGGISNVMKRVVHCFDDFAATGGAISSNGHVIFKAKVWGFLGDTKGLKEIFCSKGHSGFRICLRCKNVCRFLDEQIAEHSYLVGLRCPQRHRFDVCSDAEVYEMVDELERVAVARPAGLKDMQQTFGLNYEPEGILFDRTLRGVVKPASGWYHDWMHVTSVSGCANVELEQVLHTLSRCGIRFETISMYFAEFVLPKSHGKVNPDWFTTKRIGRGQDKDGWKGFAAEILTVVPIMNIFLQDVVRPLRVIDERVIECFALLDRILKLCTLGPGKAAQHIDLLEATIDQHAELFAAVHGAVIKPKFHFLFHVVDHARDLGRLLSCFVTERRHRMVKAPSAYIYNQFERTLIASQLSSIVGRFATASFEPTYLENPSEVTGDIAAAFRTVALTGPVLSSTVAHLLCGCVRAGDLVMTVDRSVHEASHFIQVVLGGLPTVWVCLKTRSHLGGRRYSVVHVNAYFEEADNVIAPLMWGRDGDSISIVPPPASALW